LKIQERDIFDQVKNIDSENTKSQIIIWFVWTIIAFWLRDLDINNNCLKISIFILALMPIIISLLNIWSKNVWYHLKVDTFFVNKHKDYEKYLQDIHLANRTIYENVSKLLEKKAFFTKLGYIFTIILFIVILLIKLY
jgi:hypothetical protein